MGRDVSLDFVFVEAVDIETDKGFFCVPRHPKAWT